MANIKYEDLHEDILKAVKELNIPEKALFDCSSTDVYIGCRSLVEAQELKINRPWRAMSSIFKPQKGSDMDHYPYAVDIAFGNVGKSVRELKKLRDKKVLMGNEDM